MIFCHENLWLYTLWSQIADKVLSHSVYYILRTKLPNTCAWAGSPNYLACFVVCLKMNGTKKSSTLYMASIPIHFTRIMIVPCFLLIWVHVLIAMHAMKCSIKTCLLNGCKSLWTYDNMSALISKYAHCKYFFFSKILILCLVLDYTEMTIYVSDNGILNVHAL